MFHNSMFLCVFVCGCLSLFACVCMYVCVCKFACLGSMVVCACARATHLRCVLRLLFTWPWPVQPGVGHLSTFSCMARTRGEREDRHTGDKTQDPRSSTHQLFTLSLLYCCCYVKVYGC